MLDFEKSLCLGEGQVGSEAVVAVVGGKVKKVLPQTHTYWGFPCDNCIRKDVYVVRFSKWHWTTGKGWTENVYLCGTCLTEGLDMLTKTLEIKP